eukprot:5168845-Pyramimonas_sp.AAC.1
MYDASMSGLGSLGRRRALWPPSLATTPSENRRARRARHPTSRTFRDAGPRPPDLFPGTGCSSRVVF